MASIRLEDEARTDPRFKILGKRLGTSRFDARARMEELWAYCTEKQTYYLPEILIDTLAEYDGFANLICEAEVGLGEKKSGVIRIKGTKGRIEWLKKLRKNGKKGGRPKKTKKKPDGFENETKSEPPSNPLVPVPVPVPVQKEIYISASTQEIPDGIPQEIRTEWKACLDHYGRTPNWIRDEPPIMRAYLKNKDWNRVKKAIIGLRKEIKTKDYDPARYFRARRLEDPDSFAYLEGLGEANTESSGTDYSKIFGGPS